MASTITWKDTLKKKYLDWGWSSRGSMEASYRAVKMLRPICKECQGEPKHARTWYEDCLHAKRTEDPTKFLYWSQRPKVIVLPVYDTDEDGDTILVREDTKTKLIMVPNWTEVPADLSHNNGEGPRKAQSKGFKFPMEVGLAPLCEFSGCGSTWPTVRVEDYGDYCSETHAKYAVANEEGVMWIAPATLAAQGRDIAKERKNQYRDVQI